MPSLFNSGHRFFHAVQAQFNLLFHFQFLLPFFLSGNALAYKLQRVNPRRITIFSLMHLQVQMAAGHIASRALHAQNGVLVHFLARLHVNRAQMGVKRQVSVRMLNIHTVAVAAAAANLLHMPGIKRINQTVAAVSNGYKILSAMPTSLPKLANRAIAGAQSKRLKWILHLFPLQIIFLPNYFPHCALRRFAHFYRKKSPKPTSPHYQKARSSRGRQWSSHTKPTPKPASPGFSHPTNEPISVKLSILITPLSIPANHS